MKRKMVSEHGKNFDGEILTENNLNSEVKVMFNGKVFTTGNRRHDIVELYSGKKLTAIVKMGEIQLVK